MGQFVVAGEREGNAQAITLQRQSSGIQRVAGHVRRGRLNDLHSLRGARVGRESNGRQVAPSVPRMRRSAELSKPLLLTMFTASPSAR